MKNLYHAVSVYQLLEILVFKKMIPENSILLVAKHLLLKINREQLTLFFEKIIEYDFFKANREINGEYFETIFKEEKLSLNDIDNFFVPCAHHAFGIYLIEKKYEFIFFEDAPGAISRFQGIETIEEKTGRKHELAQKYGLYKGENDLIKYIICNKKAQLKEWKIFKKCVDFDVVKALSEIEYAQLKSIKDVFISDFENIEIGEKTCLILTEHLANLRVLTWDEQILMYQLLVDYFLNDYSLIWKPHPDDIVPYKQFFKESQVIRGKFPAELLPFIFSAIPECVATISSTSINSIREVFPIKIEFNQEFSYHYKQFRLLHKYYVVCALISGLFDNDYKIYSMGVNQVIFENFNKVFYNNRIKIIPFDFQISFPEKSVIIIDILEIITSNELCIFLENLHKESVVVFINSKDNYYFYHPDYKNIWENMMPIEIKKKKIDVNNTNEIFMDLDTEIIYLYSKGGIPKMEKIEKELAYTGIKIETETFSKEQKQIKILEGLLAATEKRLLYYINREKELLNLIKEGEKK